MGDVREIPNLGQKQLNLSDTSFNSDVQSIFQGAAVTRPLMSVGKVCEEGHEMTFNQVMAVMRNQDGDELCRFHRYPSGFYVTKLKPRSLAGFGGQE